MVMTNSFQQKMPASAPYSANEMLSFLIQNGSIDPSDVANEMKKARRELFLKGHPYAVSQGSDGRWRTYFKDDTKPSGRVMVVKSSLEKLQDAIVEHYESEDTSTRISRITIEKLYDEWLEYKHNRKGKSKWINKF